MFEISLPFVLCISLLTYQTKMYISLLPGAHNQEEQPIFILTKKCVSNFSIVIVWSLSGKNSSVNELEEDMEVNKMELLIRANERESVYYMAVNKTEGETMEVFLTTEEYNAARFIPDPESTQSESGMDLLDISQPFFFRYEQDGCSYLLHCLKNKDETVNVFLQQIYHQPPAGAEPVYAIKKGVHSGASKIYSS